mgnify:FL=1
MSIILCYKYNEGQVKLIKLCPVIIRIELKALVR